MSGCRVMSVGDWSGCGSGLPMVHPTTCKPCSRHGKARRFEAPVSRGRIAGRGCRRWPAMPIGAMIRGLRLSNTDLPWSGPRSCRQTAAFAIFKQNSRPDKQGAGAGPWRNLGLHDAGDGARVAVKAGKVIVMQGNIKHVGQTRATGHLNFGARQIGASAAFGMAVWRALERQGWTTQTLRGQNVRVRGVASLGRPARVLVDDVSSIKFAE